MATKIINGGIELGILQAVGDENLSKADLERKNYLEALSKGTWMTLGLDGQVLTKEEAEKLEALSYQRFTIINGHASN